MESIETVVTRLKWSFCVSYGQIWSLLAFIWKFNPPVIRLIGIGVCELLGFLYVTALYKSSIWYYLSLVCILLALMTVFKLRDPFNGQ